MPREPVRCAVKIRYRAREQAATVYPEENGRGRIVFDAPQRTVTPGQAAVRSSETAEILAPREEFLLRAAPISGINVRTEGS